MDFLVKGRTRIPILKARRANGKAVVNCPYCGEKHRYGWKSDHQEAKCLSNPRGYFIVCSLNWRSLMRLMAPWYERGWRLEMA